MQANGGAEQGWASRREFFGKFVMVADTCLDVCANRLVEQQGLSIGAL